MPRAAMVGRAPSPAARLPGRASSLDLMGFGVCSGPFPEQVADKNDAEQTGAEDETHLKSGNQRICGNRKRRHGNQIEDNRGPSAAGPRILDPASRASGNPLSANIAARIGAGNDSVAGATAGHGLIRPEKCQRVHGAGVPPCIGTLGLSRILRLSMKWCARQDSNLRPSGS